MKIVAFLQNQWFYNARQVEPMYRRREDQTIEQWWDRRARLNKAYLFYSCLTGRRLKAAFGEELCDRIIWENVSPRIAGKASECFGVDQDHVDAVMAHFKPDVVLLFGKVARGALVCSAEFILDGPHPAARHAGVVDELRAVAHELESLMNKEIAA